MGGTKIGVDGGILVLFGTSRVKRLQVGDEDHLKRRRQRWRLRAIERLEDAGLGEIEVGEAEVAHLQRNEGVEDSAAATFVEKCFVARKNVPRTERSGVVRGGGYLGE